MKSRIYLLALAGLAMMLVGSDAWARCYVDQNAKGRNNGSTWADAYVHPQLALINGCTEIWVAKGVYTPVLAGSDPTISFEIPAGTKMYGGFAGGETSVDQRLRSINETILSGDIDHNDYVPDHWLDTNYYGINGTNSEHVVTLDADSTSPITNETIIDGFIIVGAHNKYGGALYCTSTADSAECSPTLANLAFVGNDYGAVTIEGSTAKPRLIDSFFRNNKSYSEGGAVHIYAADAAGEALISGCAFSDNNADDDGGALYLSGVRATVVNSTFSRNGTSEGFGYSGGAIVASDGTSLSVMNSTFFANEADFGGAIMNAEHSSLLNPGTIFVTNSIFWANDAVHRGPDIDDATRYSFSYVASSILQRDCPDSSSVCLNTSTSDPQLSLFVDLPHWTIALLPAPDGSAVDAGDDSGCPLTDQRGVFRPQGLHCDIGAVEWRPSDDIIFRNGFQ